MRFYEWTTEIEKLVSTGARLMTTVFLYDHTIIVGATDGLPKCYIGKGGSKSIVKCSVSSLNPVYACYPEVFINLLPELEAQARNWREVTTLLVQSAERRFAGELVMKRLQNKEADLRAVVRTLYYKLYPMLSCLESCMDKNWGWQSKSIPMVSLSTAVVTGLISRKLVLAMETSPRIAIEYHFAGFERISLPEDIERLLLLVANYGYITRIITTADNIKRRKQK